MTRVPIDLRESSTADRAQGTSSSDAPLAATNTVVTTPNLPHSNTAEASTTAATTDPVAPKELVPDIPYDEFLKTFHYSPPSDPDEVTMRGDAKLQEVASQALPTPQPEATEDIPFPAETSAATEASAPVANAPIAPAVVAKDSVDSRLGLDPAGPAEEEIVAEKEEKIERPRFLDIAEPFKTELPKEVTPANSGTATIVGPSFLGLSDAPALEPDSPALQDETAEPRSHGRLWLVAAVVALFAVLGGLEWRAQVHQTGNGPIEIIRSKMHRAAASDAGTPPEAASNDANAKPEMHVEEQPKPAANDPSSAAFNAPAPTTSSTDQKSADQNTPSAKNANGGAGQATATAATASGKTAVTTPSPSSAVNSAPATPTTDNKPKPAEKPAAPGADEMAKAGNASDSAAAAAWLWKATAKGNPDAPVQLADMYVKGDGVPRSCEQALVLLKTAAEKENTRARSRLAAMYENGTCVQRNRVEAYRWVSSALAADPNSQWARENKNLIWQQMTSEERTMAQRYR